MEMMAARKRVPARVERERAIKPLLELDVDMRALRKAFKAVKALSPEALTLLKAKIKKM